MVIGGAIDLDILMGTLKSHLKRIQNIQIGFMEKKLVMNWTLNSIEESIVARFKYFDTTKQNCRTLWRQLLPKREIMLGYLN